MKFLKELLFSDDIINSGMRAADALVLTEEERIKFHIEYMKATLPMARSRRFIAILVSGMWTFCTSVAITLLLLDKQELFTSITDYMFKTVMPPFTAVVGFYFWKAVEESKKQ